MTWIRAVSCRAPRSNRTKIITTLAELPDPLPELAEQAQNAPGDRTGWDWAGQWDGYCLDWNDMLKSAPGKPSAA
jgi:hypothetical protein